LLLVAINGNGWGNLAPSARNFFNILDAYGRCDVPIITGATSALIDRFFYYQMILEIYYKTNKFLIFQHYTVINISKEFLMHY
jgi:hypothetical protein